LNQTLSVFASFLPHAYVSPADQCRAICRRIAGILNI
jgi:hypothetical protein